jgi:hypothetical protein
MEEEVESKFADVNIKLLNGRHIQVFADPAEYNLLSQESYFNGLFIFYKRLYGLDLLVRQIGLSEKYYYLFPPESELGALSSPKLHIPLTENQTLFGLMLLTMYYEKSFDRVKKGSWDDIRNTILTSERQEKYKLVLFGRINEGNNYTDTEWSSVRTNFKKMAQRFDDLGWLTVKNIDSSNFKFVINVSIHRLEDIYSKELTNPEVFFDTLMARKLSKDDGGFVS